MAESREQARRRATAALNHAGIETASLDARLLLQAATGLSHAGLISGEHETLSDEEARRFETLLSRRLAREPVSRILGRREFHGLDFSLSAETLDPRPDTETLVDAALKLPAQNILDLGTGTGAIIVSLLHALPNATGTATDISEDALATAQANAESLGVAPRLTLLRSDWFDSVTGPFDLILSNPPYIPDADVDTLSPEVRLHDPRAALAGGPDGLSCYRAIIEAAPRFLTPGGHLLLEIGKGQEKDVRRLLETAGFTTPALIPAELPDLGGVIRVVAARIPG